MCTRQKTEGSRDFQVKGEHSPELDGGRRYNDRALTGTATHTRSRSVSGHVQRVVFTVHLQKQELKSQEQKRSNPYCHETQISGTVESVSPHAVEPSSVNKTHGGHSCHRSTQDSTEGAKETQESRGHQQSSTKAAACMAAAHATPRMITCMTCCT